MKCIQCQTETSNPKFCSRTCAAKYNNTHYPKRKPEHRCKNCGVAITCRSRYCSDYCRKNNLGHIDYNVHSIGDIHARRNSQRNSQIRDNARTVFANSGVSMKCAVCGYDVHVEICHIHAISEFPLDTPLSKVNSMDNLVALCPNHHWEFDNIGLIIPCSIH